MTFAAAPEPYVPGQLQLSGSPALDVLRIKYWRLAVEVIAHCKLCAFALRGFNRNHAGNPVASARSPMYPVPNSAVSSPSRRVMRLVMVILLKDR